jgi:predicted DNA-binding protein
MSNSRFRKVLRSWLENSTNNEPQTTFEITISQLDHHKLEALAELYQRPIQSITRELIHASIREIEEAMPYIAGDQVIRVEEGMKIYADVGPTPQYLELVKSKQLNG